MQSTDYDRLEKLLSTSLDRLSFDVVHMGYRLVRNLDTSQIGVLLALLHEVAVTYYIENMNNDDPFSQIDKNVLVARDIAIQTTMGRAMYKEYKELRGY